jgi:hypothetical protein
LEYAIRKDSGKSDNEKNTAEYQLLVSAGDINLLVENQNTMMKITEVLRGEECKQDSGRKT